MSTDPPSESIDDRQNGDPEHRKERPEDGQWDVVQHPVRLDEKPESTSDENKNGEEQLRPAWVVPRAKIRRQEASPQFAAHIGHISPL